MIIREVTEADVSTLASLFMDAVQAAGPSYYSAAQVEVWTAFAEAESFREFVLVPSSLVAEDETGPIGFTGMEPDGHVTALYVRSDRMRRGVGSVLLTAVVNLARERNITRFYAEASKVSRPVFERAGFRVAEVETVERHGVLFERYRMVFEAAA
jgi:putative acetyltransferase